MPCYCRTPHIYSFVAHVRTASSVLRTCAPLTVSRHGAICTRSLVSELTDSLRLIIKRFCLDQMRIENRIRKSETKDAQICAYLNKGCSSPRAYNILASAQQSVVRSTKCFCIFQNVSSTFARFIGEAKGDIRISQLNTFFRICFILTINFTLVQTSL